MGTCRSPPELEPPSAGGQRASAVRSCTAEAGEGLGRGEGREPASELARPRQGGAPAPNPGITVRRRGSSSSPAPSQLPARILLPALIPLPAQGPEQHSCRTQNPEQAGEQLRSGTRSSYGDLRASCKVWEEIRGTPKGASLRCGAPVRCNAHFI